MAVSPVQVVKVCIALLALGLAFWLGGQGPRADLAEYKTKMAERTEAVAELATRASELAREEEQAKAAAIAAIADKYEQEQIDVQATHDRVVADLRAGNLWLQERWSRCSVPQAGAGTGEPDAGAEDRAEGAAAIVRAAAEADAQIRGLQAVIRADREEP